MQASSYDNIFSLGGNCAAAAQLRRRGLRKISTPLDWIGMASERSLRYMPVGFKTRFADLGLKENMRLVVDRPTDGRESGWSKYCYIDELTDFKFIHHFDEPIEAPGVYDAFRAIWQRRFERFFATIDSSDSTLFLLETSFTYDFSLANDIFTSISALWPEKHLALRVMQFSAEQDESMPDVLGGGGLYRYRRMHNLYDFSETNWEWSFLDSYIQTKPPRKPHGLARIAYKISKSIRNSLKRRGYDV